MIRMFLGRRGDGGEGEGGDSDEEDELLRYPDYDSNNSSGSEQNGEESEEEVVESASGQSFDITLPARHLYLGELDEEAVASVQETETIVLLPLLCIPQRVVFPGETVPMHIQNPHEITMVRGAYTSHKPIALATDLREISALLADPLSRPKPREMSIYGTTVDVIACREDEHQYWYGPRFIVKLLGRQRFRLLDVTKRIDGLMDCRVQIVSEDYLLPRPSHLLSCPLPLATGCQGSLHVARLTQSSVQVYQEAAYCKDIQWSPRMSMSCCSIPGWVFRLYDEDYLRERIIKEQHLKTLASEGQSDSLPQDIADLSYWLSRRLPVNNEAKLELLSISCPTLRVMEGLRMLNEFTELLCSECGTLVTQKHHIFCMSVDGPVAAYVNPGGYVHDTLTVMEAENLKKSGRSSTEHSWFPGYKWTIMNCRNCKDHKGWLFEAVRKNLTPLKFHGLRRQSLDLKKKGESLSMENTRNQ